MKNLILKNAAWSLVALTASAFSFSACSSDEEMVNDEAIPLKVNASIAQVDTKMVGTEVPQNTEFETGAEISLFLYAANNPNGGRGSSTVTRSNYTKGADGTWDGDVYFNTGGLNEYDAVIGLYPSVETNYTYGQQFSHELQAGQSEKSNYLKSDLLMGKDSNKVGLSNPKTTIAFNHLMAQVKVVFNETNVDTEGAGVKIKAQRTYEGITLSTQTGTGASGELEYITIMDYEVSRETNEGFAVIPPQTLAANSELFQITVGGVVYTSKSNSSYTLQPGKCHTFTLALADITAELDVSDMSIGEWTEPENWGEQEIDNWTKQ